MSMIFAKSVLSGRESLFFNKVRLSLNNAEPTKKTLKVVVEASSAFVLQ